MNDSLKFIYNQQKELSTYSGISALLGWDQMTYMPKLGIDKRSQQNSLISRIMHEKIISNEFWNHIKKLVKPNNFDKLQIKDQIVVKRLYKDVQKSRKIPSKFVEELSKTTTISYNAWEESRNKNNYKIFSPHLEKIIDFKKKYCDIINIPGHIYNSLLDDYEEGMTVKVLKEEFNHLEIKLTQILNKIKKCEKYKNQNNLNIEINSKKQQKICDFIISKMGLPRDKSRIDISTHPFTTSIGNNDVRITTNIKNTKPFFSLFSTVHESGHALYELGILKGEYLDTVISDAPSLGMHESQSRFWENMIGKSISFWKFFYPYLMKKEFKINNKINFDLLYDYINQVKPSLIRIEADELTYCLHVILRFNLELDLISDKLTVSELPQLWNEKIYKLLGVKPNNDKDGVLQDMHWSGGNFGYFPTYAIGSIYAAQIFDKLQKEIPTVNNEIELGDFSNIINWLKINIYNKGRIITADEVIKNICGENLNSEVYTKYLKKKYFKIYDCN
ncbi:MAG: carboxypeptidase M32 [Candidatus Thermoplasmatota archaeon]|nr:carboxypeptidase M32 [Candidatus Thermoplasmatota archaeon]